MPSPINTSNYRANYGQKRKPGKKTESRQGVTRVEDLFVRKEVEADDN